MMLLLAVVVYQPEPLHSASLPTQHLTAVERLYAGPTVWSSLPDELKNSDSLDSLKWFLD